MKVTSKEWSVLKRALDMICDGRGFDLFDDAPTRAVRKRRQVEDPIIADNLLSRLALELRLPKGATK